MSASGRHRAVERRSDGRDPSLDRTYRAWRLLEGHTRWPVLTDEKIVIVAADVLIGKA